jgi:hypothetical protein
MYFAVQSSSYIMSTSNGLSPTDQDSSQSTYKDLTTAQNKHSSSSVTTRKVTSTARETVELSPLEIDEKVQEIVKNLKIYKIPKRPAREAPGGEAIGAVALFILIGILGGIVLLDLVTIQNHLQFFLRNINIRRQPYRAKRDKKKRKLNERSTQTETIEV